METIRIQRTRSNTDGDNINMAVPMATSHGFGPHFTTLIKNILWKGTMLFIGLSGWFFAMGTAIFILSPSVFDLVRWILIVSIIVYMVYVFRDDRFIIAIRYYFPLMIFNNF
jgi:hypothetical protein